MQSSVRCLHRNNPGLWLYTVRFKSTQSHYAVLGIKQNATKKEVRDAFLELSKKHHPDQTQSVSGSHEKFVRINEAYTVLSKEESRRQYDLTLRTGRPPPRPGASKTAYRNPYQQPPTGGYYDPYGRHGYNPYGHDPYGRQNPFENFYEQRGKGAFDDAAREEFYQRQREAYKREREYHQKQSQIYQSISMRINRFLTQAIVYLALTYVVIAYLYFRFSTMLEGRQAYQKRTGSKDVETGRGSSN